MREGASPYARTTGRAADMPSVPRDARGARQGGVTGIRRPDLGVTLTAGHDPIQTPAPPQKGDIRIYAGLLDVRHLHKVAT